MDYAPYNDYQSRTAGRGPQLNTIQGWKTKKAAPLPASQNEILANLEKAQKGKIGRFDNDVNKAARAYAPQAAVLTGASGSFKFGDLVDMVNPLHHLPVVGMVYRGLTDDKIGPMAQIIGGAVYGGPIGAVAGTVNAVTKMQTGQDVGDHVMGFAGLKTERNLDDVISRYEKVSLESMPKPEKIQTLKLNS